MIDGECSECGKYSDCLIPSFWTNWLKGVCSACCEILDASGNIPPRPGKSERLVGAANA